MTNANIVGEAAKIVIATALVIIPINSKNPTATTAKHSPNIKSPNLISILPDVAKRSAMYATGPPRTIIVAIHDDGKNIIPA